MSVFVYRKDSSEGARDLVNALGDSATRYRAIRTPIERKVRNGDVIIAWGEAVAPIQGVRILNGTPLQNKFQDAVALKAANVATVEVSQQRPAPTPVGPPPPDPAVQLFAEATDIAEEFLNLFETQPNQLRSRPVVDGINQLQEVITNLRQALYTPAPTATLQVVGTWLARQRNHVGGADLLANLTTGDYFSKKEELVSEYRVHSFLGKSIRLGKKEHRNDDEWTRSGRTPHAWVRSWDAGWRISYADQSGRGIQRIRDAAHAAIAALKLDFGAVDIGITAPTQAEPQGKVIVLEVNRAPGLSDGTAEIYADAITRWIGGTLARAA